MSIPQRRMLVSPAWLQIAILTFLVGFTVLGVLAVLVKQRHPPTPQTVTSETGSVLFTREDILAGQHLFQKSGLMQYGTLFGHGAYLGPDFTAQYLHEAGREMVAFNRGRGMDVPDAEAEARREMRTNTYDPATQSLRFGPAQARAFQAMTEFYTRFFGPVSEQTGLRRPQFPEAEARSLTAYFAWAAWVCTATRPGTDYSYTNNWPADVLAGNQPTAEAYLWSALSLIALLGGTGIIFFLFGRYNLLGWHRRDDEEPGHLLQFRPPEEVLLTPSQRATAWYFLVVAGLFLAQGLLGGVNAHYHVEPKGFYGLQLAGLLPYNLSRTWHLQLALFFVSASFLAMGIFITPMIARKEPRGQSVLAGVLFAALVAVVVGSLSGEAASYKNVIPGANSWFWVGAQGWEYLDLGRLWQILLVVGMALWVFILVRGMRGRLAGEHPGNMPYLFLYSALSIPLFYAVGLAFGRNSTFAVVDFWRFWVVHLWVEDFLELFTTIMVAYLFVLLGVVRPATATRIIYLDVILYSIGGVIGTMHHLYFSGTPAAHMALGAFFSAMEVIPLVLLTYEAWRFMRLGRGATGVSALDADARAFPHKWAVMFLIAVGFWNFLGAGVFGFLINLPIVSYYEIGTQFTANHGHGAMMGVYGMLAIGFLVFVSRYFVAPDRRSERAMRFAFWGLNGGLAWMTFANLVPVGGMQFFDSVKNGYWHARHPDFFARPDVRVLEWLRFPGDVFFIVVGILPVVYLAIRTFRERRRYGSLPAGRETEDLTAERRPA